MTKKFFIREYIEGYIEQDILKMKKIASNNSKTKFGRLYFPIILTIFSSMFYLSRIQYSKNEKDEDRAIKYITEYFSKETKGEILANFGDIRSFVRIFRHGTSHLYFPKLGFKVSRSNENKLFLENDEGLIFLNIITFANCYLESLKLYKENIETEKNWEVIINNIYQIDEESNNQFMKSEHFDLKSLQELSIEEVKKSGVSGWIRH